MKTSSKRAQYLAIAGIVLSVAGFLTCFIFGAVAAILPVRFLAWQILGGVLIWTYLAVLFRNKSLAEQEKLDEATFSQSQDNTIFQSTEQRAALFNVARKRLESFNKWGTIVFSVLIALYSIAIGVWLFRSAGNVTDMVIKSPLAGACAMVVVAFFSFLIARYATGMAVEDEWKHLKAGGSYLLSSSLLAFIIGIGLALRFFQFDVVVKAMAWVIPVVMCVYGFETILNAILDIYRPRIQGQYHRVGFDSRIFGIINEPGSILHTAASTIDYQFGFKVSQTWFYKLVGKAVMPLFLFLLACAYNSSSILVVDPGRQAAIEHFGSTDGGARIVGPGLHFKWPWPIDIAYIHDTERIQQINIGISENEKELYDENGMPLKKPLLWGQKHYESEYRLLVATETDRLVNDGGAVPVSVIIAAVPVQFKVKDVHKFLYQHTDPRKTLQDIAYREIARYMASAKLETDVFGGSSSENQSVLGAGRSAASHALQKSIQDNADKMGLGVEILMVGLEGIHPPLEVAADYEKVIGAIQQRQRTILDALSEQNKVLTELGGSIPQVDELYKLAQEYQQKKVSLTPEQEKEMAAKLDSAFEQASGEIFKKLSESQRYAYSRVQTAKATGERFANQVMAYNSAPQIYMQHQRLNTLEEILSGVRKYVVISDKDDEEVMIIDLQEKLAPSLYDIDVPK